jgi:hypothetical protein
MLTAERVPRQQETTALVSGFVFIAMPMISEDPALEDVHHTIKEVAKDLGLEAERVDDPASNQRITDRVLKVSRAAQRERLTAELPRLQAKSTRLAKMVGDLDDSGPLLAEYQAVEAEVKDTKDQLAYLDRADDQAAIYNADAAALEATWTEWLDQAEKDPGVSRQMLRKALATSIVVQPTGKATWSLAGFGKVDEIVAGGIGRRVVVSELRDSGTASAMISRIQDVLAAPDIKEAIAATGFKHVRLILREDGEAPPGRSRAVRTPVCPSRVAPVGHRRPRRSSGDGSYLALAAQSG